MEAHLSCTWELRHETTWAREEEVQSAYRGGGVGLGSMLQQDIDDVCVALLGSLVQRCVAILGLEVAAICRGTGK